ncbi:hypothetical protein FNV43_RR25356 [Rhamnella rubrinervis]|uniref:Sulfotransferase n=1 Tax=Rhamnella rubrinervis TaxID=2594499 RepID=A0A8K0DU39_9ROSA|nr:hypothetical protein FNV43_RR25356 [Rhamnella rubrinervis]
MGITKNQSRVGDDKEETNLSDECKEMLLSLPREKGWRTTFLYEFQGFWCQPTEIQAIMSFQKHFQACDTDVVLATIPKSGTTWLKALAFAIVNRNRFPINNDYKNHDLHPLLTSNPHDLVPFLEYKLYSKNQLPDLSKLGHPRIFGTHIPFPSLANSVKKSNSKIVYLCRNPFDTFVSSWIYINKIRPTSLPELTLDEAFDRYCKGIIGFGPFWEHMLGYWKESIEKPNKVLFLKYEDLKDDTCFHLKRLAKFLDSAFSFEEERDGVIEKIVKLCSFENLKELEVNKNGRSIKHFENKNLFRKAEVGDWVNYLSPKMADKLSKLVDEKLRGSGLKFKVFT